MTSRLYGNETDAIRSFRISGKAFPSRRQEDLESPTRQPQVSDKTISIQRAICAGPIQ